MHRGFTLLGTNGGEDVYIIRADYTKNGNRATCNINKKEMAGLVDRMKKHYNEMNSELTIPTKFRPSWTVH